MEEILTQYATLLARVDEWFSGCISQFPGEIACGKGCSACCRGLFDITLLDAQFLRRGFELLPEGIRCNVLHRAEKRLSTIRASWPEFAVPFILNCRPDEEWAEVMPDDDETPCVLLGPDGLCSIYNYRPMTCRLHGLPLIDVSGETMEDEWCPLNFTGHDPLLRENLRYDFLDIFQRESLLIRKLTTLLFPITLAEMDTLIPTALLLGADFNWKEWFSTHQCRNHLTEKYQL